MEILIKQVEEILELPSKPFLLPSGHEFNHAETIKRIESYRENKFVECKDPNAIFWNDVEPEIPHFAKNIDLDTKNLRPTGRGDLSYGQAFVLRAKYNNYAKRSGLAISLDDNGETLAVYGSAILKGYKEDGKDKLGVCSFSKVYFDPTVDDIKNTEIVEVHEKTARQIAEEFDIDEEEVKKTAKKCDESDKYKVYQFYGYSKQHKDFYHCFLIGTGEKQTILLEDKVDPTKYKDRVYFSIHISAYRGRFLRVGCYERSFPEMERQCELVNHNSKATAIASLLLLRTADPNTRGNVLDGAITGQIVNSQDLEQIGITNQFYNEFINEMALLRNQIKAKCMTPEIITGDNMPSSTPFRSVATISNAAKSAFKSIRDRVGDEIVRILNYNILPSLVKDWNKGGYIEIAEDLADIRKFDQLSIPVMTAQWVEAEKAAGRQPAPADILAYSDNLKNEFEIKGRKLKIDKGYFDFEFGFDFNPTGENYDKQQQNDAYAGALDRISANPAIQNHPLFQQYLENNGISPVKLTQEEMAELTQNQGQPAMAAIGGKQDKLMSMVDGNV